MAGFTLGTAWLQISPSFRGLGKETSRALSHVEGQAARVGERAGGRLRRGMMLRLAGAGTAIAAAIGFKNLAAEAAAASDATDKFKQTLQFAGLDKGLIDRLATSTRKYADQTIYDLKDIQTMTAQLGANGVKDFDKLAMAAGNLNAVAGGNKETYRALGLAITQVSGAGKLMTQDWNQIVNAIPGASGKLQEAMRKNGAFTGEFRDAMAKGQITADEFNQALLELGMDDVAQEAATSTTTLEGSWENLKAAFVGGMSDIINKVKPALTGFMNWLTEHSEEFFNAFVDGFSTVIDILGDVVDFASNNSDWLVPLAVGLVAGAGAFKMASAAAAAFNLVMSANPIVLVITAIAALVAGLVWFFTQTETGKKIWEGFTNFLREAWDWIKSAWDATWSAVKQVWDSVISPVISALVDGFQGAWDALSQVFSSIVDAIKGPASAAFNAFKTVVTTVWGGIKTAVTTAWNLLSPVFGAIVNIVKGPLSLSFEALKMGVTIAWNVIKTAVQVAWGVLSAIFTVIVNVVRVVLVGAWNFLSSIVTTVWNGIRSTITTVWGVVSGIFNGAISFIRGAFVGTWNFLRDTITTVWNGIKSTISTVWNGIVSLLSTVASKLNSIFVKPFQNAAEKISEAWGKIKGWMASPVNWVIDHVINGGVIAFINSILGALGLNSSKISKVPRIKAHAKGGRAKGWSLVGEEGPELVNFTQPGRVYTAAQTAEAITMAGRDIHPSLIPDRPYTPSEAMLAARAMATQDPKLLKATLGSSPAQALLPIGGFLGSFGKWVSDAWDGVTEFVADIGGKAVKFVRGRLADAAKAVINPLQNLTRKHLDGVWEDFFVGAGDKLINFIAGVDKDTKEIKVVDLYADAAAIINAAQAGQLLGRALSGGVSRPLAGGRLTSPFGVGRYGGMHSGIDLAAPTGTPVFAYRDGVVTRAGWNSLAGRSGIGIVLAHAGGMGSYYGHLSAALVGAGAQVRAGQQIGRVGSTGRSTGPHLHWEISLGGNPQRVVNPMPYLRYDSGGWLQPGVNTVVNQTRRPEPVLTASQWDAMETLAGGRASSLDGTRLSLVLEDGRELRGYIREEADAALLTSARDLAGRRR